jgi:lipoprotein NlpI
MCVFRLLSLPVALALTLAVPARGQTAQEARAARNAATANQSATAKYQQGNFDGAITDWTKAVAAQPQNPEWVLNRGLARARKKDFAGAITDFSKTIDLKPDYARAYVERAFSRFWLGIDSNAMVDIDRAIALEPLNAEHVANRAQLKRYLGDYRDAIVDSNTAQKMTPKVASIYIGRAAVRQALGDLDGAIADYQQAISVGLANEYVHLWLFTALRLDGQDGFPALARAVSSWPEGWGRTVSRYLLDSLPEKDFLAQAEKAPTPDRRREQLCEAHFFVGATALAAGNPAKARAHFEKSAEQNIRNFVEDTLARGELSRLRAP